MKILSKLRVLGEMHRERHTDFCGGFFKKEKSLQKDAKKSKTEFKGGGVGGIGNREGQIHPSPSLLEICYT